MYGLNSSKFPEDSAVHSQDSPYTLQGIAGTPPQMSLVTPELLLLSQVTYLVSIAKSAEKLPTRESLSNKVTHLKTLHHHVEIPEPNGICSELIRHFRQGEIFIIFLA